VINFALRLLYHWRKSPPPPRYSLGESQGRSECFWRRESFLSLPGVEQWFVFRPTCSDHYTEWAIRNEPKVKGDYRVSCFFNPDVLSCRWIPTSTIFLVEAGEAHRFRS
jgi:putative component of membrane protein insertase Oxa1/YidC/SpoIIIJ protein YidD